MVSFGDIVKDHDTVNCSTLPSVAEYKYLTFLTKTDGLKLHTMISLHCQITSLFMIIRNYSGEMANLIESYYLCREYGFTLSLSFQPLSQMEDKICIFILL